MKSNAVFNNEIYHFSAKSYRHFFLSSISWNFQTNKCFQNPKVETSCEGFLYETSFIQHIRLTLSCDQVEKNVHF